MKGWGETDTMWRIQAMNLMIEKSLIGKYEIWAI